MAQMESWQHFFKLPSKICPHLGKKRVSSLDLEWLTPSFSSSSSSSSSLLILSLFPVPGLHHHHHCPHQHQRWPGLKSGHFADWVQEQKTKSTPFRDVHFGKGHGAYQIHKKINNKRLHLLNAKQTFRKEPEDEFKRMHDSSAFFNFQFWLYLQGSCLVLL